MKRKTYFTMLDVAQYFIESEKTVREIADEYGSSKSTIWNYLTRQELKIDYPHLFEEVRRILDYHTAVRSIRGGESTKLMWENKKEKK